MVKNQNAKYRPTEFNLVIQESEILFFTLVAQVSSNSTLASMNCWPLRGCGGITEYFRDFIQLRATSFLPPQNSPLI